MSRFQPIEESLGRNLEVGLYSRGHEGQLLWLAPHGLVNLLSYITQYHLLRIGTSHSELGPPISTINQGKHPTDLSTGQSDGVISHLRFPLP